MPIRPELRPLYPPHWRELSGRVRIERAAGKCQRCGRPHLALVRCLPDGRWFDRGLRTWRDRRGHPARWPDLLEMTRERVTRVVLAAAHIDHNPRNNRTRNLASLCQRCHLLHDRPWHLLQRWITYRRRYASADLFIGPYRHGRDAAATLVEIAARISERSTAGEGGMEHYLPDHRLQPVRMRLPAGRAGACTPAGRGTNAATKANQTDLGNVT